MFEIVIIYYLDWAFIFLCLTFCVDMSQTRLSYVSESYLLCLIVGRWNTRLCRSRQLLKYLCYQRGSVIFSILQAKGRCTEHHGERVNGLYLIIFWKKDFIYLYWYILTSLTLQFNSSSNSLLLVEMLALTKLLFMWLLVIITR